MTTIPVTSSDDPRFEFNAKLKACIPASDPIDQRVYYHPGENSSLIYPCITYVRRFADQKQADNMNYINHVAYWVTVLSRDGENDIQRNLLQNFNMCRWENEFTTDGVTHSVFTIYYRI